MREDFEGADPTAKNRLGEKLSSAAMRLDPEAVTELLAAGAPADYAQNAPLRGLIHQMIDTKGRDRTRIAACGEALLTAGAGDAETFKGLLKAAVLTENMPLVKASLERGADIEPEMRGLGYNRMVLAAGCGMETLVDALHRDGSQRPEAYEEALSIAAERGHARIVDRFIDWGVDATKVDVVFCAAVGGQVQLVKDLAARGFTTDFKTPVLLEAALDGNHGAMLDFLLDQGADRNLAHAYYTRASNRDQKPYAAIHTVLKMWSERSMTVVYPIPDPQNMSDLRAAEPDHLGRPQTLLVRMAKVNRFGDAMTVVRAARNDRLEVQDLLSTDGPGNTLIEILGARRQLGEVFTADLWQNRQEDFAALYAQVAPVYRDQIDYQGMVSSWRRQALSRIRPKIPKLKG